MKGRTAAVFVVDEAPSVARDGAVGGVLASGLGAILAVETDTLQRAAAKTVSTFCVATVRTWLGRGLAGAGIGAGVILFIVMGYNSKGWGAQWKI